MRWKKPFLDAIGIAYGALSGIKVEQN